MNMGNQYNNSEIDKRNIDIVWVEKIVPNTQLNLCYCEIVTI
jgi:hypothetical protein